MVKSIEKEMGKARITHQHKDGFTPDDICQHKALVGYKEINGHWIFDIKMDGKFTRKSRFVEDTPSTSNYSTVVTR